VTPDYWVNRVCLAISYRKLGRHADAAAIRAREQAEDGDGDAYKYAQIDAQWGNRFKALDWLDTAMQVREGDPLMKNLRSDARYKAFLRKMNLPDRPISSEPSARAQRLVAADLSHPGHDRFRTPSGPMALPLPAVRLMKCGRSLSGIA
jgi:hypothetical protein